jgi:protein subunit release factor A
MVGGGPCAVWVTHTPTGTMVIVDDQATTKDNQERALDLLLEALQPDR